MHFVPTDFLIATMPFIVGDIMQLLASVSWFLSNVLVLPDLKGNAEQHPLTIQEQPISNTNLNASVRSEGGTTEAYKELIEDGVSTI